VLPMLPAQTDPEEGPIGRGPIISASPPSLEDYTSDYDATSLAGANVLVVDDDVRNVFALTSALEMHGARVLYADNGADGLELLQEHPEIDLVLMDVMMPDMDGNETTAAIRLMPGREQLPVLFLTAKAMPGDREKSLAAGASDYITKPVDLDRLLHSMRTWLGDPSLTADTEPT
jgi:CheY-like chemotaxis protein